MPLQQFSTFVDLLRWRTEQQADHRAYTFVSDGVREENVWTYSQLECAARRVGAVLQAQGAAGERVLLLYPPGLEFIAAFFGCLYAGAIAVPAYPPRNTRHLPRIQTIVQDAEAKFLLTLKKTQQKIEVWLEQRSAEFTSIRMLASDTFSPGEEDNWKTPESTSDDLAFLQYTSGSTSAPKGVMVSHHNLLVNSAVIQQAFSTTNDDMAVSWLPPYHDMGLIGGILQPLYVGFSQVLMAPTTFLQKPFNWLHAISTYQGTVSGGPNFAYDLCVSRISEEQKAQLDLQAWNIAFNGSEPIYHDTLERFSQAFADCGFRKESFYPCYGLAESTLFVTGGGRSELPISRLFDSDALETSQVNETNDLTGKCQTLVGCGQNVSTQTLAIVDPATHIRCQPDQVGEIWLASASVTRGYWRNSDATEQNFRAHLADTGDGPFLRTGDLGFLYQEELFIAGRIKDLIIIRGRNHYPQDIEWTVENCHAAVRENCSAAFAVTPHDEERLVIVAEVERRFMRRHAKTPQTFQVNAERRHQHERPDGSLESGVSRQLDRPFSVEDVVKHIRKAVAEAHELQVYAIQLLKFGTIPRTSSGKIRRHTCKQRFLEGILNVVGEWREDASVPSTDTSTKKSKQPLHGVWQTFVAQAWAKTLKVGWTTMHGESNFFQLGGDSLHATTATGIFSDALGVELEPDLLYEYSTVHALATYFEREYGNVPGLDVKNSLLEQYRQYCRPTQPYFPLLPLQQSFYIARIMGGVAIFVLLDIELRGTLQPEMFRQALHLMAQRHPALRLAYETGGKGPEQTVRPYDTQHSYLSYSDLSKMDPQEKAQQLEEERMTLARHTFQTAAGLPLRVVLLRLESQSYHLLINFDHLAIDGFSLTKFFEDLQQVYTQLQRGEIVDTTSQTSISFKEYVEIHTFRPRAEQHQRDLNYWLRKIPMYEPFPEIANAGGDDTAQGFDAYLHTLDLSMIAQLRSHARTYNVTLFSIFMAAFFKLLALWSGSRRLTINTPHLNRHPYSYDVQDVLGCFTDILPIRVENVLDGSLLELVNAIHHALAEMHRHSSVSGVDIARALAKKEHDTPHALSPIIFSSALFHLEAMSSEETYRFASIRARTGAPETWLDVLVYEACGEFDCSWNFFRPRFSRERIVSLARHYERILANFAENPKEADPLRILLQDAEFAECYAQHQQNRQRKAGQDYWHDTLRDLPALRLPFDYSRRPGMARHIVSIPWNIPDLSIEALQQQTTEPEVLILAAFISLLSRYAAQQDLGVWVHLDDGDTHPYRIQLNETSSVAELVQQLQSHKQAIAVFQEIPFADLWSEVQAEAWTQEITLPTVLFTTHPTETADYDLVLYVDTSQHQGQGSWSYDGNVFEAATIQRMGTHLDILLAAASSQPGCRIVELPLLSDAERQQILVDWNDTHTAYPLDQCIHELVEAQVQRTPDAVALLYEEHSLTYRELHTKANQLAHYLRTLGVGPDVLVGVCLERSFEMLIGLLGILKAGGAYVPMDPEYPQERLAFMLQDAQVPVLLTQQHLLTTLPPHEAHVICLDSDWATIAQQPQETPQSGVQADNLIYVMYTSGSTGTPKGAMNLHRALVNRLLWMQEAYQLRADDRVLHKTPFSFDVSGWEFWWPLISGAQMVIAKPGGHKDSAYLTDLIRQHNVSTVHFVPPMLQVFLEEDGVEQCRSLRRVICSGEALSYDLQERFFSKLDAELHNLYGPTEAAIDVTCWPCQRDSQCHIVPIGWPIANTQLYVLDARLQPVPIGVPGELHIGGVNLARGYLNRPVLTREKFIPNPFHGLTEKRSAFSDSERLYKTGDLVRFLPDGTLEYLGRLDHQVKIRGFRIELGEIEATLRAYPHVREAVVIVREDQPGEKRLIGYVVAAEGNSPTVTALREFLGQRLPDYMAPATFVLLDALPLTPNGKVDRRALPAPEGARPELSVEYVMPQNEIEGMVTKIWQEMLPVETIGIYDNFFELGGDSLLAVRIHKRLQEVFGPDLSVVQLFQYPTVHTLAAYLSRQQQPQAEVEPDTARQDRRAARQTAMRAQRQRRQRHRTAPQPGESDE